ncbi:hypothetical protein [Streptomyces sp. NPDC057677]|uniref:hypothetical protein n=1 Tax=unclassified Streptomyces TaxID=2593676 RepID=UPI00367BA407
MTATPNRPGLDQLTSDMLDQLYDELTLMTSVIQLLRRQQAEAEATLTAVRDELAPVAEAPLPVGWDNSERDVRDFARKLLADLDGPPQHGQTPA